MQDCAVHGVKPVLIGVKRCHGTDGNTIESLFTESSCLNLLSSISFGSG
jgi:hypothetical protein